MFPYCLFIFLHVSTYGQTLDAPSLHSQTISPDDWASSDMEDINVTLLWCPSTQGCLVYFLSTLLVLMYWQLSGATDISKPSCLQTEDDHGHCDVTEWSPGVHNGLRVLTSFWHVSESQLSLLSLSLSFFSIILLSQSLSRSYSLQWKETNQGRNRFAVWVWRCACAQWRLQCPSELMLELVISASRSPARCAMVEGLWTVTATARHVSSRMSESGLSVRPPFNSQHNSTEKSRRLRFIRMRVQTDAQMSTHTHTHWWTQSTNWLALETYDDICSYVIWDQTANC